MIHLHIDGIYHGDNDTVHDAIDHALNSGHGEQPDGQVRAFRVWLQAGYINARAERDEHGRWTVSEQPHLSHPLIGTFSDDEIVSRWRALDIEIDRMVREDRLDKRKRISESVTDLPNICQPIG